MKNKIFRGCVSLSIMFLLPSCFNKAEVNATEERILFIQALPQSALLTKIVESISEEANDIIKEEMGLAKDFDFNFFLPKTVHRLTLYYINDIKEHGIDVLVSVFDSLKFGKINAVSIGNEVEFFGGQFNEQDELVILINDNNLELLQFSQVIKTAMHQADNRYRQRYHRDLYNKVKSERYPYVPHIGLGRIRTTSIKNHLKDASQFSDVFDRIQKRIKDFVHSIVKSLLTAENNNLVIDKICISDMKNRICIKDYAVDK